MTHDRYIISNNNVCFNVPLLDTISSGQRSDIKAVKPSNLPFEHWWKDSRDIIEDWDLVKKAIEEQKRTRI